MKNKEVNTILLEKFPFMNNEFESYVSWQDGLDTGSICVVEDVLMPLVFKELSKRNSDFIKDFCAIVEELYCLNDEYFQNVINIGILENLKSSNFKTEIENYLLPNTKKSFLEINY